MKYSDITIEAYLEWDNKRYINPITGERIVDYSDEYNMFLEFEQENHIELVKYFKNQFEQEISSSDDDEESESESQSCDKGCMYKVTQEDIELANSFKYNSLYNDDLDDYSRFDEAESEDEESTDDEKSEDKESKDSDVEMEEPEPIYTVNIAIDED